MGKCANCGEALRPAWKYCIKCGMRVVQPEHDIPGAIRPEPGPARRKRPDPMLAFGAVMAVVGVALIVWVAIVVFTPRG
ncbi:zinc ribbon domain-containing protein [Lacisediminihabitans profunda]|uniref:Zinc ribbon domain-containing protein n=1 Tax=Lacisediminihabitans profunda TaxID=2594790 RepID=A0A5C8UP83_9MICO|nr:zinc ribbon domain-containing protein [Lacisediminihabitans profunda]TXN30232.1 zinc ribbon domain-containing protein [Lacisediminihabitans profunda]